MKRLLVSLLMTVVFVLLTTFSGWLIWITYVRPIAQAAEGSSYKDEFEEIAYSTRDLKAHFHNIDETISIEKQNPTLCFKCHGTYAHSKAKDIRSFLNFHSYFISCEVCHMRREEGRTYFYKWIKPGTDDEILTLSGRPGNYGAVIVPFSVEGGAARRLDKTLTDKAVQSYMKLKDSFTADQAAEAKLRIHEGISNKPVFCDECHRENGYLDFRKLHYPPERAKVLTSIEVVGMIQKYKNFYLPTMFDPDAALTDRQQAGQETRK